MRRLAFVVLVLLVSSSASAKELHWKRIGVDARLDAEGNLHVRETQTFVFTGDWNGGERTFRTPGARQSLGLVGVRRITAAGQKVELRENRHLGQVDEYAFFDREVLRWRSRLPSDPPFANSELTYEIEYVMSGVVTSVSRSGERIYVLDHDFAFDKRPGAIDEFELKLTLDPAWSVIGAPLHFTPIPLPRGESFVVRRELRHSGAGTPGSVLSFTPPFARAVVIALLLAGAPLLFLIFLVREKQGGRFAPPDVEVDRAWLEANIFSALPEVIGYMYDGESGPAEVGAAISRMVQSGKLESRVERRWFRKPILYLTRTSLDVELDSIEKIIIGMFFVVDAYETDTQKIRKHYRNGGLDPGKRLEEQLRHFAYQHGWSGGGKRHPRIRAEKVLLAGGLLLIPPAILDGFIGISFAVFVAFIGGLGTAAAAKIARTSKNRLDELPLWWAAMLAPLVPAFWFLVEQARREDALMTVYSFISAALFLLSCLWFVLDRAMIEATPERIALRKRMAAAKRWFARELRKPRPELKDAWVPWLLALGLDRQVGKWFAAFGGEGVAGAGSSTSRSVVTHTDSAATGGVSGSSIGGSWSGGGTSFGGAGATAAWGAAATGLSARVSPAFKSGGGGSSGSGSGGRSSSSSSSRSSGGGGGGGW